MSVLPSGQKLPTVSSLVEFENAVVRIIERHGGGSGTTDYNYLANRPTINQEVLEGDRVLPDTALTNLELEVMLS